MKRNSISALRTIFRGRVSRGRSGRGSSTVLAFTVRFFFPQRSLNSNTLCTVSFRLLSIYLSRSHEVRFSWNMSVALSCLTTLATGLIFSSLGSPTSVNPQHGFNSFGAPAPAYIAPPCRFVAPTMMSESEGSESSSGRSEHIDALPYPVDMDIKVIGDNEGPFVTDILQLAAECIGVEPDDVQVRWRDKGKFRAITLRLHFQNAEQVYAVYAAMDRDPRVRYKL
jgi:putative lipoic acid-binding regulatory protein